MDPESAQENIAYARALNSEHQMDLLNTLAREFVGGEYRLLVVDSIMNCFRVDYCGRGELAERQQKLNQFLMRLAHMAEEFNVAVLMVCLPRLFLNQSGSLIRLPPPPSPHIPHSPSPISDPLRSLSPLIDRFERPTDKPSPIRPWRFRSLRQRRRRPQTRRWTHPRPCVGHAPAPA